MTYDIRRLLITHWRLIGTLGAVTAAMVFTATLYQYYYQPLQKLPALYQVRSSIAPVQFDETATLDAVRMLTAKQKRALPDARGLRSPF